MWKAQRKKERKEGGNGALLISTSYTTREFRRLKAEIEPSTASALADSISVGPHARLWGVDMRLNSPPSLLPLLPPQPAPPPRPPHVLSAAAHGQRVSPSPPVTCLAISDAFSAFSRTCAESQNGVREVRLFEKRPLGINENIHNRCRTSPGGVASAAG